MPLDLHGGDYRQGQGWPTPHELRHFCASRLYLDGMGLYAIQELLGHAWTGTTDRYVHVHAEHIEEASTVRCSA